MVFVDCLDSTLPTWSTNQVQELPCAWPKTLRNGGTGRSSRCIVITASTHKHSENVLTTATKTDISAYPESLGFASIYKNPQKVVTAHDALESLISGQNVSSSFYEKELSLRRSLRDRRETVQELIMEALRAEKLGPTFSRSVVNSMTEFVDHVMIEAAALRKIPEYANAPFSYRVRLYIERNRVAKTIRWLKHNKFTATKIGKLVYMVEDYENNLQPKIRWLKRINIRGRELGVGLMREPRILERPLSELNESVRLLEKNGIKSEWIGWVLRRSPKILAYEKQDLQERIDFYTKLGVVGDDFGRMVYNFPACLGHFSLEEMQDKLDYLRGFGLDDENLGRILVQKPQLIACSIDEDWKPLVKFLYYLGVDGYGLRRIVVVKPSIFCLNLSENIAPKIRFLRDVGIQEEAIGDVLVKYPQLLSYSLDKKIRPLVMFLLEKVEVPIEKVGKVLALQPDLIGCSLSKKLEVIADFFIFHGFKKNEIGMMITDFPMLLKYSLTSLKPKLRYVLRVMRLPVKEVIKFPRLFSYALDTRIKPRYRMVKEKGLGQMNLRTMLTCSDDTFLKRLEDPNFIDDALDTGELSDSDLSVEALDTGEISDRDLSDKELDTDEISHRDLFD